MQGKTHSSLGYTIAQKTILKKIHEALGFDKCVHNGFVIGGSAVSPETVRYLLSLDLKLLETTSMTEQGGLVQVRVATRFFEVFVGELLILDP